MAVQLRTTGGICPECGALTEVRWAYCQACAAPLQAPSDAVASSPADAPSAIDAPRPRRRFGWRVAVLLSSLALLLAVGIFFDVRVRLELGDTHAALANTEGQLADAKFNLAGLRVSLASTHDTLVTTTSQLAATTADRDTIKQQAAALQQQITGLQGSLSSSQAATQAVTAQRNAFRTCAADLTTFINDVGNGTGNPQFDAGAAVNACNSALTA
jgi:hypothetical protein